MKTTMRNFCILKIMVKIKRLTIPNADRHIEQWELTFTAGENVNWSIAFGEQIGFIC